MRVLVHALAALVLGATACTSDGSGSSPAATVLVPEIEAGAVSDYGAPPPAPSGDVDPELEPLLDDLARSFSLGLDALTTGFEPAQLDRLVATGDGRILWILSDLIRFPLEGRVGTPQVIAAYEELSGLDLPTTNAWVASANPLIAWDLPAPPGYLDVKRSLFTTLEPKWAPLFDDDADVDWRLVSWGGVLLDDRLVGDDSRCERGCIPALDDPVVTDAAGGSWYPDDRLVFGVEVDGEARAYPKNMMEVHEMVNDTIGGRRIALPYCTLCGSAQAYFTDDLPAGTIEGDQLPILRTSGLLVRSNKMMFELRTFSLVDTFLGNASSGPLHEAGIVFPQLSVVTSTWGEWKQTHPNTTIVAEDGGIGRIYELDPLRGRDDDGPIFPVGDVDPRLAVQEPVLGFVTAAGVPVAVHVAVARAELQNGSSIEIDGTSLQLDGDGVRAVDSDGLDVGAHQAFWFAWSQFHPDTTIWPTDFAR